MAISVYLCLPFQVSRRQPIGGYPKQISAVDPIAHKPTPTAGQSSQYGVIQLQSTQHGRAEYKGRAWRWDAADNWEQPGWEELQAEDGAPGLDKGLMTTMTLMAPLNKLSHRGEAMGNGQWTGGEPDPLSLAAGFVIMA